MTGAATFAVAALFSPCAWAVNAQADVPLQARLAAAATRFVSEDRSDGLAVSVVHCGHASFILRGVANREDGRRVKADTVFEIGSVSKTLTSLLLAHAVTEGRLRIDDDVRRHLPGRFEHLQWQDGTPVTLGQLADTTSGLPDYLPDPAPVLALPADQQVEAASKLLQGYDNDALLRDLRQTRLLQRPGTQAAHSNLAAQLLGLILARTYGQPFAQVLLEKIEMPAGMRDGAALAPENRSATGYDDRHRVMPPYRGESVMPAGGLRYSAQDMAQYLRLLLAAYDRAVQLSQTVRFSEDDDRQIAMTWVVSTPRPGLRKYRLSGGTFGSSSYIEFYPSLGYGVALMANRASGQTQDALQSIAERAFEDSQGGLSVCSEAVDQETALQRPLVSGPHGRARPPS
jgi:CubicO group peptidase (beta-lactamase class C family)